ncbi:MAG: hypothetical protein KDE55_08340 [Novosphingobium sp.]|nr:hypothetical protein [Novosphingobium sp.]
MARIEPGQERDAAAHGVPLRLAWCSDAGATKAEIANSLYRATLDLLRWSDDPSSERHFLLEPLSKAVASQKYPDGQFHCARLAQALEMGDYDGALDACLALVEISRNGAEREGDAESPED